jgi:hypothetical protein
VRGELHLLFLSLIITFSYRSVFMLLIRHKRPGVQFTIGHGVICTALAVRLALASI